MGWGIFPDVKAITCPGSCNHLDCAWWLARAKQPCPLCGEPFEAEDRYYNVNGEYVHADCLEDCGGYGKPEKPSTKATEMII